MNELILYTSALTDTRHLEQALTAAGRRYRIERMGMGDAAMRERFEALCEEAGVRRLPLIRDGERWLGELELLAELGERPASVSDAARGLGFAGLLPFTGGALAIAFGRTDLVSAWLAYAVLILAFMAGTQWGAALAWRDAPWSFWLRSVAAPLVAWPLVFAQPVFQAYGLALLFGGLTMLDRELAAASRYPQGYLRLRWQLSSVVIVALILGALLRG